MCTLQRVGQPIASQLELSEVPGRYMQVLRQHHESGCTSTCIGRRPACSSTRDGDGRNPGHAYSNWDALQAARSRLTFHKKRCSPQSPKGQGGTASVLLWSPCAVPAPRYPCGRARWPYHAFPQWRLRGQLFPGYPDPSPRTPIAASAYHRHPAETMISALSVHSVQLSLYETEPLAHRVTVPKRSRNLHMHGLWYVSMIRGS